MKMDEVESLQSYIDEQIAALHKSAPSKAIAAAAEKLLRERLQAVETHTEPDTEANQGSSYANKQGRKLPNGYMDSIGNTPLMRLINIGQVHSIECNLYAKCEFMNPSGSSKARTAAKIVKAVSQSYENNKNQNSENGQAKPVLLHSRLGLAGTILARVNGLPSICMGNQVRTAFYSNAFTAHGGFLINSKAETLETLKDLIPDMVIAENVKAIRATPNSVISEIKEDLQRLNPLNPKIDMLVCTAEFLLTDPKATCDLSKETALIVVGERPTFSCDFPITHYYQINNNAKMFEGALQLVKDGIFCCPKDGAVVHGALQSVARLNLQSNSGVNVVLVLNESLRPYSQCNLDFLDSKARKTPEGPPKDSWWAEQVVGDIKVKSPGILDPDMQIQEAIRALQLLDHDQAVVQLTNPNVILGITSLSHLESQIQQGTLQPEDTLGASGAVFKKFHIVKFSTKLKDLIRKLFRDRYVCIVVQQVHECVQKAQEIKDKMGQVQYPLCMVQSRRDVVLGLVTQFDVLEYIAGIEEHHLSSSNYSWNQFK